MASFGVILGRRGDKEREKEHKHLVKQAAQYCTSDFGTFFLVTCRAIDRAPVASRIRRRQGQNDTRYSGLTVVCFRDNQTSEAGKPSRAVATAREEARRRHKAPCTLRTRTRSARCCRWGTASYMFRCLACTRHAPLLRGRARRYKTHTEGGKRRPLRPTHDARSQSRRLSQHCCGCCAARL